MSGDRPSFSLRSWAWVAWLPLGVLTFATARRTGGDAYAVGALAGSLLLPLAVSWLSWRFGRPSATRASIVFVAVILVSIFARLAQIGTGLESREEENATQEVLADLGKETEALRDQAVAELESGESETAAGIERSAAAMEKAGRRLQGGISSMMLAVADSYRELLPAARTYDAAWKAFADAGGVDPATIEGRAEISERVALARSGVAASRAFRKTVEAFPATAVARVEAVAAADQEKRDFTAGMSTGVARFVGSLRTVDHDAEAGEIMIEMLQLLDREWGRWRVNGERLDFDGGAALEEYGERAGRLQAVLAAQQEIAEESLRGAGGPPPGAAP